MTPPLLWLVSLHATIFMPDAALKLVVCWLHTADMLSLHGLFWLLWGLLECQGVLPTGPRLSTGKESLAFIQCCLSILHQL